MARRGTTLTRRGMTDKNFVRYGVDKFNRLYLMNYLLKSKKGI